MAAMRTTVGAAFAKGTGRAISSVVGGAKNVSGKLKNIDGRELAQLYSDNTALFRLDVDSTYNPRRYQRGGGNESGPFQGFSGLDGQVDA